MSEESEFPYWLQQEKNIKRYFELLDYEIEEISVSGRQIDIIAKKPGIFPFEQETWIIEVTTERVGKAKGGTDSQKLLVAAKDYDNPKLMILSTSGFTDDQKASLKTLGIYALTVTEFEKSKVNLRKYAIYASDHLTKPAKPDIGYSEEHFIEPLIELRKDRDKPEEIDGDAWIQSFLESDEAGVCAILGNLGMDPSGPV